MQKLDANFDLEMIQKKTGLETNPKGREDGLPRIKKLIAENKEQIAKSHNNMPTSLGDSYGSRQNYEMKVNFDDLLSQDSFDFKPRDSINLKPIGKQKGNAT